MVFKTAFGKTFKLVECSNHKKVLVLNVILNHFCQGVFSQPALNCYLDVMCCLDDKVVLLSQGQLAFCSLNQDQKGY